MKTTNEALSSVTINGIKYSEPLERNQIRILTLSASRMDEAQIQCSLKSFDNPPPYIALSYTWGDQTKTNTILVDDQPFDATENLENALKHLRDAEKDLYFWVDAICINQRDEDEKEHQLQLMPTIFSQAQETRVWLGAGEETSDRAIDLINKLSHIHLEAAGKADAREAEIANWALSGTSRPWTDDVDLVALQDLLIRDYWYRVWVVQEIAMSKKVSIFCGRRELSWNSVLNATEFMIPHTEIGWIIYSHVARNPSLKRTSSQGGNDKTLHDGMQRILSIQSVRNDKLEPGDHEERPPDSLLFLLSNHRSTEATEARDKYYALAGLVPEDNSIISQRSSAKSVEDIYILAAESTTKEQQHGALDFLDFAGWPRKMVDLPSWVPDWSYTRDRAVPLLYWQLAGKRHKDMVLLNAPDLPNTSHTNTFTFRKHDKSLLACGFQFDTINGVSFSRWPNKEDPHIQNPRSPPAHEYQEYPTDEPLVDVIWKTFVMNLAHAEGLKAPPGWGDLFYQRLFRPQLGPNPSYDLDLWYEQNKDFEIYGVKLEDIARDQRELRLGFPPEKASATDETLDQLLTAFDVAVRYRRLATTTQGYLCLAPSTSRLGDLIVTLLDCRVPVVLRRERDSFKFIGTCYVHGIMEGGAAHRLSDSLFPFEIY